MTPRIYQTLTPLKMEDKSNTYNATEFTEVVDAFSMVCDFFFFACSRIAHVIHCVVLHGSGATLKEKELMTTKPSRFCRTTLAGLRSENWRFQMVQFLSREPHFVELLEWIENKLHSEEEHIIALQENNIFT